MKDMLNLWDSKLKLFKPWNRFVPILWEKIVQTLLN